MKTMTFQVKGMQHRVQLASLTRMEKQVPLRVKLKREPGNEHDKNAIQVVVMDEPWKFSHVGYVPRGIAEKLARKMDNGRIEIVKAQITDIAAVSHEAEMTVKFRKV